MISKIKPREDHTIVNLNHYDVELRTNQVWRLNLNDKPACKKYKATYKIVTIYLTERELNKYFEYCVRRA